jgi:hypothetical protein
MSMRRRFAPIRELQRRGLFVSLGRIDGSVFGEFFCRIRLRPMRRTIAFGTSREGIDEAIADSIKELKSL